MTYAFLRDNEKNLYWRILFYHFPEECQGMGLPGMPKTQQFSEHYYGFANLIVGMQTDIQAMHMNNRGISPLTGEKRCQG